MKYCISPAARADLRGIWVYTADNWSTPRADKYILSIEALYRSLSTGKVRGRAVNDIKPGYLRASVAFRVLPRFRDRYAQCYPVLHKRMNFATHLPDDLSDFKDE